MSEPTRARAPGGLRWIAILVALVFGCTTVRAPASAIGDTVPVTDGRAEPQLELWVESARTISPAESARAAAEARAALASAVAARQAPDGDTLLVVRAQGVARTGSRRSSQGAAIAGLVVGAVVVVVVAVVMLVAGDGHGTGAKNGKAAKAPAPARATRAAPSRGAAPGAAAAAGAPAAGMAAGRPPAGPRAPSVASRGCPGPRPLPPAAPAIRAGPGARPSPRPWLGPGEVARADSGPYLWFDVWYGFSVDLSPGPWAATYEPLPPPAGVPDAPPWEAWPPAAEGAPAPPAQADVKSVVLPPPPELRLTERDFFAGDETVLELTVVDRHTGAPLRSKTVRAGADPRDARAIGKLLDRALQDENGWEPLDLTAPAEGAAPAAG